MSMDLIILIQSCIKNTVKERTLFSSPKIELISEAIFYTIVVKMKDVFTYVNYQKVKNWLGNGERHALHDQELKDLRKKVEHILLTESIMDDETVKAVSAPLMDRITIILLQYVTNPQKPDYTVNSLMADIAGIRISQAEKTELGACIDGGWFG